jgi:hypothetical protein
LGSGRTRAHPDAVLVDIAFVARRRVAALADITARHR